MKTGRIAVLCITAILIFLIAVISFMDAGLRDEELSFCVRVGDNTETITCWEDAHGNRYVFLPSYAQLCDVRIRVAGNSDFRINNIAIEDGMSCDIFLLNQEYHLSGDLWSREFDSKIKFVRSENIPAMYIDTKSGSMGYIHKEKGNEEYCEVRVYTETGDLNYRGDMATIKGRGNSTWKEKKKPYNIILDEEENLLDMGSGQRWVLLANTLDPSNLANKIAYDLAKEAEMEYSPDCTWIDLYLNGEYAGLYLLSEKIEVNENRVEISEEDGFLVSAEGGVTWYGKEGPKIATENTFLRIHHSSVTESSLQHIWQSAENAIVSEDGIDDETGKHWLDLIDLDSWAMRFLLDETLGNYDGGVQSQFYYGSIIEGKIYAGPIWDLDASLGKGVHPHQILTYNQGRMGFSPYYYLFQKQEFYDRAIELYETVLLPHYEELLDGKFMQYAQLIWQSASMNQIRWNAFDFTEQVKLKYDFLKKRISFFNELWLTDQQFCEVHIVAQGTDWKFAVPVGTSIPITFDQYTDKWYDYNNRRQVDLTQPIYESCEIWHEDAIVFYSLIEDMDIERIIQLRNEMRTDEMKSEGAVSAIKIMPVSALIVLLLFLCIAEKVKRNGELANDKKRRK